MSRLALVDADSIVYVIAYNHKESLESLVLESCDSIYKMIMEGSQATHHFGSFSPKVSFRDKEYLYAPYKGTRPTKPEWVTQWESTIKNYFVETYGFVTPKYLEADDIVSAASVLHEGSEIVICSPDKDMKQLPGLHFDYKKPSEGIKVVSQYEASINFWTQMLCGDEVDNIKGVPGLGPKKVAELFSKVLRNSDCFDMELHFLVKEQYTKYFGEYYGTIIYDQTYNSVKMLMPSHPYWEIYKEEITFLHSVGVFPNPESSQMMP